MRPQRAPILLLAAAASMIPVATGRAETALDLDLWSANRSVLAQARDGNTLYIGGQFTLLGRYSGGGVPLHEDTGVPLPGFSTVRGTVRTIAPDEAGGFFIGGTFDSVGHLPRRNLAHIGADGIVTGWTANTDGVVRTLACSGSKVFVGGAFLSVDGQARTRLAALEATTGAVLPWNPGADGEVWALGVGPLGVYVGGAFNHLGGQPRTFLGVVDSVTGVAGPWAPAPGPGWVNALEVTPAAVYVGGPFIQIAGVERHRIAALDPLTGAATAWNPDANNNVSDFAISGSTMFISGGFTAVGGKQRVGLAEVQLSTGVVTNWDPGVLSQDGHTGFMSSVELHEGAVYVAGDFNSIGGAARHYLAAVDPTTGHVLAWNPSATAGQGPVPSAHALAAAGDVVFAGGSFSMIGALPRRYLAAIDLDTGTPTDWNPDADWDVSALTIEDGTLYAGGRFFEIGGVSRPQLAAFDLASGDLTAWNPDMSGVIAATQVWGLDVAGDLLYVGGSFTHIGNDPHLNVAAIHRQSGVATAWSPAPDQAVFSIDCDDGTVWMGGIFEHVSGVSRYRAAAVDSATGAVLPWDARINPGIENHVDVIVPTDSDVLIGGQFQRLGPDTRFNLAAADRTTGAATPWIAHADGFVFTLDLEGGRLYAGGGFTSIGGATRWGMAALDLVTGQAIDWIADTEAPVYTILANGSQVTAGGRFHMLGAVPALHLVSITDRSLVAAPPLPPSSHGSLSLATLPQPWRDRGRIRFHLPTSSQVELEVFDARGRSVHATSASFDAGAQEILLDTRGFDPGVMFVRLKAAGRSETAKIVVLRGGS